MVMVVDQTIDEALRLGASTATIKSMVPFLNKYSIDSVDVSLRNLKRYGVSIEQTGVLPFMRCIINPSLDEISQARQMGFSKVVIRWFHQSKNSSLDQLIAAFSAASEFSQEIYLCIENVFDLSLSEFACYYSILTDYKVKRFIYHDQGGTMEPFRICQDLKLLKPLLPCLIEFHAHNTYGLATANSLAAIRSGVSYVATAVSGIGLPNHAAMEEVLMAVKLLWKRDNLPSGSFLANDCKYILSSLGIHLPVDKALIGRDVFAHESGIHVDGITKNPLLYEVIQPEEVGQTRQLIIGKHSGTVSLKMKFLQWHLELDQAEAVTMLAKVRKIAISQKRSLSDLQLQQLYWRRNEME